MFSKKLQNFTELSNIVQNTAAAKIMILFNVWRIFFSWENKVFVIFHSVTLLYVIYPISLMSPSDQKQHFLFS